MPFGVEKIGEYSRPVQNRSQRSLGGEAPENPLLLGLRHKEEMFAGDWLRSHQTKHVLEFSTMGAERPSTKLLCQFKILQNTVGIAVHRSTRQAGMKLRVGIDFRPFPLLVAFGLQSIATQATLQGQISKVLIFRQENGGRL